MKTLIAYLPQDVLNIVLDYVYKPDMKKLNNEYSSKYWYSNLDKCLESKSGIYNYRFRKPSQGLSIFNSKEQSIANLPCCYRYSSGCNRYDGYIDKYK